MTITQKCQLILFRPEGRIDLEGGKSLSEKIALVEAQSEQLWILDLAKVDFMDSAGLVFLVNGLKSARNRNCRLVLCNVPTPVRLVLELTQLDSVFEVFSSYEDIISTVS
ncbi:MAG: STAS domain-containing protein [Cyanobacteria bacterium P01_A01_bin.45]